MARKRMSWQTAHYLGVLSSGREAVHLLGTGVRRVSRTPAPKTSTEAYINQRNASVTVTGYETRFTIDYDDIVDDAAVQALQRVADEQLIGADAEFHYYRVDLLGAPVAGAYPAWRCLVACAPSDEAHEALQIVTGSCVLQQVGDMVKGRFNPTTRAFTPLS